VGFASGANPDVNVKRLLLRNIAVIGAGLGPLALPGADRHPAALAIAVVAALVIVAVFADDLRLRLSAVAAMLLTATD
jgi:hypothetical protein